MDTHEPGSDYKTLLRLTLETAKEHAGASSELASEVGSLREDILGVRAEIQRYAAREAVWEGTVHRLDEWLQSQARAAQAAQATADASNQRPGMFERMWDKVTLSMESATTRTALLAVVIPLLSLVLNRVPSCSGAAAAVNAVQGAVTPSSTPASPASDARPNSDEEHPHVQPSP